jgi:hypothetical protein
MAAEVERQIMNPNQSMGSRLFALLVTVFVTSSIVASERPNILRVTSEDNSPYLGCYGDPLAQTPHLDRLAEDGIRYRLRSPTPRFAPVRAPRSSPA